MAGYFNADRGESLLEGNMAEERKGFRDKEPKQVEQAKSAGGKGQLTPGKHFGKSSGKKSSRKSSRK